MCFFIYATFSFISHLFIQNTWAQEDEYLSGESYYYGLGVDIDYKKSYKMFQEEKDYFYLALMYLNGEGQPSSIQKAEEMLNKMIEEHKDLDFKLYRDEALASIIHERKSNPQDNNTKLHICDFAYNTLEINHCMYIREQAEEYAIAKKMDEIRKQLSRQGQLQLEIMEKNFQIIKKEDADKIYTIYIDGTIRTSAASITAMYLAENHKKCIVSFLETRNLPLKTKEDYKEADKLLNKLYQEKKKSFTNESLRDNLKISQRAWIKYRDAWEQLLLLYRPHNLSSDEEISHSIKTYLTLQRIEELKYDPLYTEEDDFDDR